MVIFHSLAELKQITGLLKKGKSENRKPYGFDHQIGWAFRLKCSHNPVL
jgi:hypothetical protein